MSITNQRWPGKTCFPFIAQIVTISMFTCYVSTVLGSEIFVIEQYDMAGANDVIAQQFISRVNLIDIDADGDVDMLQTSWDFFTDEKDPTILFLNDGTGVFSISQNPLISPNLTVGSQAWPLIGDFNQDGVDDLYVFGMGNEGGEELNTWWMGTHHQLFLQNGTQGLLSPSDSSAFDHRRSIIHAATFGDIDGDGDLDIFNGSLSWDVERAAENGFDMLGSHFYLNDGAGNLSSDTTRLHPDFAELGYHIQNGQLVDIDNDGDLDLLLTGSDMDKFKPEGEIPLPVISIFHNDGNGYFQRAEAGLVPSEDPVGEGWNTSIMQAVDVDGDGWQDIFVTLQGPNLETGNVQLLMNNGDGSFRDASENMLLESPWSPETEGGYVLRFYALDFNGDNWPDLFTYGSSVPNKLLINQGDGTLVEVSSVLDDLIRDPTSFLDVADIDGDGDPDIVQTLACNETTEFCPAMVVSKNIGNFNPVTPPPLPEQTSLSLPANAVQVASPPNLSWQHAAGAQEYRVQISRDPLFTLNQNLILDYSGVTGNQLNLAKLTSLAGFDGLQLNTRYYWRVAPLNYSGQGPWTDSHIFDFGEVFAFTINAGLNDAWVSADAPFQGFFFTVFPDLEFFFLSWFTFDSDQPDESVTSVFGAPDQRWVTGAGFYSGNNVTLNVELTTGGIFNGLDPLATQQVGYGTITIVFISCNEAILTYDFPSVGLSGEMTLTRVVPSNVALCEAMSAP